MPTQDRFVAVGSSYVVDDIRPRYRAGVIGVTLAATPSDFLTIIGSSTKKVRVLRIAVSGAAATASQIIPVQIVARSTAASGGTSAAATAVPMDSSLPAATSVVTRYTANPTVGTLVGIVDVMTVNFALATAVVQPGPVVFDFTARNGGGYTLNATTEALAVNLNGVTLANATTINVMVEWIEE